MLVMADLDPEVADPLHKDANEGELELPILGFLDQGAGVEELAELRCKLIERRACERLLAKNLPVRIQRFTSRELTARRSAARLSAADAC